MKPYPSKCPHCGGSILILDGEPKCLMCGREVNHEVSKLPRINGPVLPVNRKGRKRRESWS